MPLHLSLLLVALPTLAVAADPLPNTKPLDDKGDLSLKMVEGIDAYLTRATEKALAKDHALPADAAERAKAVAARRETLRKILGVVDERVPFKDFEYLSGKEFVDEMPRGDRRGSMVAVGRGYLVYAVRWPVLPGVEGDGLLLDPVPAQKTAVAHVVAWPDTGVTPEQFLGLEKGLPPEQQLPRRLAEAGCRVLVPAIIDRRDEWSANPKIKRATNQSHREFVYRMAYEMGRHPIGYDVQKTLAAVEWLDWGKDKPPVAVLGVGEGAIVATCAAALDDRIKAVLSCGWAGWGPNIDKEPVDRNVWRGVSEFGRTGLAHLLAPRPYIVTTRDGAAYKGPAEPKPGRGGAAPGTLEPLTKEAIGKDWATLEKAGVKFIDEADADTRATAAIGSLLAEFGEKKAVGKAGSLMSVHKYIDPQVRQKRQFDQIVGHVQKLWRDSETVRAERFAKIDRSSPEAWDKSVQPVRDFFGQEVIGKLPAPDKPMNPRAREIYDTEKWVGYEVTLDLYDDVFAYGILLLPKGMKAGEKRPVVVCQHGLEGRPTDVCDPKTKTKYYNSFGAALADRGYIVFAPQNPYIHKNTFRQLQRKANPIKLSLFSFIVRQHERILDWLGTLPQVDGDRIGFYGLSYGGKTAMRVPALLPKYKLSICSGDFNEWIGKNVSVDLPLSYMFTNEYEMPEFDLGHTFNYAEMAYLIAPRPFMVERGHDDGVGTDEMVAYEYAKVRRFYTKLKAPGRTEIEFFDGGHEIHGKGTFDFLEKHLGKPK